MPAPDAATRPFLFLDRDGTIIEDRHFLGDPAGVALCPGAAEGLARLQHAYRLVVVSNQSGIARGLLTAAQVGGVNARLTEVLREAQVELAGIYWCPHGPDDGCDCRKPLPGMIRRAQRELGGDLRGAAVVGDRPADLQLARNLGLPALFVQTGPGRETAAALALKPELVADDLRAVAAHLLGGTR